MVVARHCGRFEDVAVLASINASVQHWRIDVHGKSAHLLTINLNLPKMSYETGDYGQLWAERA